jgi:hypothetical protein
MKIRLLVLVIGGLALSASAFGQDKGKDANKDAVVRELDADLYREKFGQNYQILVINAEVLAKAVPDARQQARLKKAVNFTKEQMILFAWRSEGDDKFTYTVHTLPNGGKSVIFNYDPGKQQYQPDAKEIKETFTEKKKLTWQYRLFAISRNAAWLTPGWPYVPDSWSIPKKLTSPR